MSNTVYIEDDPVGFHRSPLGSNLQQFTALEKLVNQCLPEDIPEKAVIKPNLCDIVSWDMGVTTDPAWLPLLAQVLRRRRADVQIQVVESDAISAYRSFRSCDETYDRLGYREAAERAEVELINLSREKTWEVAVPELNEPLRIPELFFDEFLYISLANVKVHPYERFTGTLKNGLGLLPQADISRYHMRLPEVILAIYRLCTPDLAILDGRIGLEGKGPIIGDPKPLGKIIVGQNGLAVDEVACQLIGAAPEKVPHVRFVRRALNHDSRSVKVEGNMRADPFAFDPQGAHPLIVRKFALRRFHRRLEANSLRWLDWWLSFKNKPFAFLRRAIKRFVKGDVR